MPSQPHFPPQLFAFLRNLKRHNHREWFRSHKADYEHSVREPFLRFISDFQPYLQKLSPHLIADPKPSGGSLLRIYKDLRFRPDAPPYQTHAAARFPHNAWKKTVAPGFYLHLEPKKSFFAGGLWRPDPQTRARVRDAIMRDPSGWKKVTRSKAFKENCQLSEEMMKRLPPGVDPDHPLERDLQKKDFIMWASFSESEVSKPDFLQRIVTICRASGPFMEFLTRGLGLPWAKGDKTTVRDIAEVESFELL